MCGGGTPTAGIGTSSACAWRMEGRLAGRRTGLYDEAVQRIDVEIAETTRFAMQEAKMTSAKAFLIDEQAPYRHWAAPARAAGDDDKKRSGGGGERGPGTAVITKTKPQTKRPSLYRVLILNDDYTPMEFVVHVLERFFNKNREAATEIMLHVHNNGIGECGVFTYEVAETKVTQVMDFARKHQHPLQCVMEKK